MAPETHRVVFTMHHIVSDGWSLGVLAREMSILYGAYSSGFPSPLPELPVQYADFALWQRELLDGPLFARQLAYWRDRLTGAAKLNLPTDRPHPAVQTFRGASHGFDLPDELARAVIELARRVGVTLFMALLAGFKALAYRYSGQRDIVVGIPIAGRVRTEIEGLIGFFVNNLVLRTMVWGDLSAKDLLRRIREVALGAYANQDWPFEKLVQELQPDRDLSREPLFQVMFTLQNIPVPTGGATGSAGITLVPRRVDNETAKYDLSLFLVEGGDSVGGRIEYNTELYDPTTVVRMLGHYRNVLEELTRRPEAPISELSLLTEAERQQVLREWARGGGAKEGREFRGVGEVLEKVSRECWDAVAVSRGGFCLSYGELGIRSNRVARRLRALGVRAESRVCVLLERSVEMVVAVVGVVKSGGAYVPMDPTHPEERLRYEVMDSKASVVMTERRYAEWVSGVGARVLVVDEPWGSVEEEGAESSGTEVSEEQEAYTIYTSGSTGRPKGVSVTQGGLWNLVSWHVESYGVSGEDRASQVSSASFDASVWELWPYLVSGARVAIVEDETRATPSELLKLLESERVTLSFVPTPLAEVLLEEDCGELDALRCLLTGGDRLRRSLSRQLPFELRNNYGPTENTVVATSGPVGVGLPGAPSIGRPIAGTETYVLDGDGNAVPVGVTGELYLGGSSLARGYVGGGERTAERFVPHPHGERAGGRLYRTGDQCRWRTDGQLDFLGRRDHQVKLRGHRIELSEIEALLEEHEEVEEGAVLLHGNGSQGRLTAYVVPASTGVKGVQVSAVKAYLRSRLPEYMIPQSFALLGSLPRTPSGKIDRNALPAPERSRPESSQTFVAPRTAIEEELARVWADVLGLDEVGVHANFFELGGDSILSIQVVAKAHQRNLHITPRQVFEFQTVAELANAVGAKAHVVADQSLVTGEVPLTPIQRWFFEQGLTESHYFNQSVFLDLRERVDAPSLREAAVQVLLHHDALRMRFAPGETGWRGQCLGLSAAEDRRVFVHFDFSHVAPPHVRSAVEATARALQESLHLSEGPLVRVALMELGGLSSRLLIVAHHLVVDGVSWRILLEDLYTAYQQACRRQPVRLMPKTTSFKDWSRRLHDFARSDDVSAEATFWTEGTERDAASLPLDRAEGVNDCASTQTVTASLSPEETRALLQQVPRIFRTEINDVLLTALVRAFAGWTGRDRLLVDLEGHGREDLFDDVDVTRTVGWFTTMYPVFLDGAGITDPRRMLLSIKEQLRRIPRKGIGFGLLRYLGPDGGTRERLGSIRPEVRFNYLGQFGQEAPQGVPFAPAPELAGAPSSPRDPRSHLLNITGTVMMGRLLVHFRFSENLHRRSTIDRLAGDFTDSLRELLQTSESPETEASHSASDFVDFHWSAGDLEHIDAAIQRSLDDA